jgi:hypothetical protein
MEAMLAVVDVRRVHRRRAIVRALAQRPDHRSEARGVLV